MGADFSHLAKADVGAGQSKPYEVYQIDSCPTLWLKPAGEVNKPFFNATLRRARSNQSRRLSDVLVKSIRNEDRKLYARHIVERWEGVTDAHGQSVEATPENIQDFLTALPDWIFDEIRAFAGNLSNFLPEGVSEAGELGKD